MKEVAFLFSGGVDSTAGAVRLLETFHRVHLLTWETGGGILFCQWSRRTATQLASRYPDRVLHTVGSCADLFHAVVKSRLVELYSEYRSRFVWCLGCKVAMHLATLCYCRSNGIRDAADGSAPETPYYVEQMPATIEWLRGYYARHGVTFHTPVHSFSTREEKIRLLDEEGLSRGRTVFGRNPGTQPFCLPGNFIYLFSTIFKIHPEFDVREVKRFLSDSEPLFEQLLQDRR